MVKQKTTQRQSVPLPSSVGAATPANQSGSGISSGSVSSVNTTVSTNVKGGSGKGKGKNFAQHNIQQQLNQFKNTALYLRGRDCYYPDAAALARFNQWVAAHVSEIDPAEQKVCVKCGHVDFQLCAHSIKEQIVDQPVQAPVVPDKLRHHRVKHLGFFETIRLRLAPASFDTHSQSDARLHGFKNHHLPDDLIIPELFSYLTLNMQTSYAVNGVEDRALRLSHVHRLAQKWVITKNLESNVESDQHYCVRVKFTIQRACDNAQNKMLYAHRDPVQNFGLAWLPKSRAECLMLLFLVGVVLWNFSTTLGLILRLLEVVLLFGRATLYILNCVAVTVPVLVPNLVVSATAHQSGNTLPYQCVSTSCGVRWHESPEDAFFVIQSCNFTDWVMAGLTEVSCQTSEIFETVSIGMNQFRDARCNQASFELEGYRAIWSGEEFLRALNMGVMSPWDVVCLWAWMLWAEFRFLIFRC